MNKALVLVLIAEVWMTVGQICLKVSADRIDGAASASWIKKLLKALVQFPSLWMGAAAMLVGLLFWFAALAQGELSYVYLLGSIQYIFALIAAHFFLQEKITATKLIGTLLITLGIILTVVS